MRQRNHTITFRLSADEMKELKEKIKLCNVSQQSYIINAILNSRIITGMELNKLKAISLQYDNLLRQIKGISNNINQQAKAANISIKTGHNYVPDNSSLHELSEQIHYFQQELEKEWKELRKVIHNGNK